MEKEKFELEEIEFRSKGEWLKVLLANGMVIRVVHNGMVLPLATVKQLPPNTHE